jgi:hypothetical protein
MKRSPISTHDRATRALLLRVNGHESLTGGCHEPPPVASHSRHALHYVQDDLPSVASGRAGLARITASRDSARSATRRPVFDVGRWNGGALLRPPFGVLTNWILGWRLRPVSTIPGTPIEVRNQAVIHASHRARLESVDRCRTVAVVVGRLPVGSTRLYYECSAGRLSMEGAPGRTAQRCFEERATALLRHYRRREGRARRAHIHTAPYARRLEHHHRQP